jgi:hypothetical protein
MPLRKLNLLIAGSALLSFAGRAQLTIQSGATFAMQAGSQVTVQGNVENAGSLSNDGVLKVQANFLNTGTYNGGTSSGVLELFGNGPSNLNAGSSPIPNLVINKAASTDVVKLLGTVRVSNSFNLINGIFTTDPLANPAFSLSSPVTAAYSFTAGKEIIGSVKRTEFTAGIPHIFNQPNMLVTTNGGTTPTDFTVTMIPGSAGGDPGQAEREVKRKFTFAQTGGSGFTADIRYPYSSTELNTNTETRLVPWKLETGEWNARLTPVTRDASNDYVSTTGIPLADLALEWKLADPDYTMNITAFLRGAWNSGTQLMNSTTPGGINSILPTGQPYNNVNFNNYNGGETVPNDFFPAHPGIVDWVLVDFRKPTTPLPSNANFSTSIGRRAAFLLNNGTVVDLDGVRPLQLTLSKQGTGFLVLKHRNHLGVMSNALVSNETGTYSNDFSALSNINDNRPAITNAPAQDLPGSLPAKLGLWAGNANQDVTVNIGDVLLVKSNANLTLAGYTNGDINLDGVVNIADVLLTKVSANGTAQTHTTSLRTATGASSNNEPIAHIPVN